MKKLRKSAHFVDEAWSQVSSQVWNQIWSQVWSSKSGLIVRESNDVEQLGQMKKLFSPLQIEVAELRVKAGAILFYFFFHAGILAKNWAHYIKTKPLYDRMLHLIEGNKTKDKKAPWKQML